MVFGLSFFNQNSLTVTEYMGFEIIFFLEQEGSTVFYFPVWKMEALLITDSSSENSPVLNFNNICLTSY